MTCIVAMKDGDKVMIGGDSAGVGGLGLTVRADSKVFVNGSVVMGYTSSFRMGQLLRYHFKVPRLPKPDGDLFQWMVVEFIEEARKVFKDKGYATVKEAFETGGTFIVGVRGEIFTIEEDFQVGQSSLPYHAVGCGEDIALGAMFASADNSDGKARLKLALEAAQQFSVGVRAPFVFAREP